MALLQDKSWSNIYYIEQISTLSVFNIPRINIWFLWKIGGQGWWVGKRFDLGWAWMFSLCPAHSSRLFLSPPPHSSRLFSLLPLIPHAYFSLLPPSFLSPIFLSSPSFLLPTSFSSPLFPLAYFSPAFRVSKFQESGEIFEGCPIHSTRVDSSLVLRFD